MQSVPCSVLALAPESCSWISCVWGGLMDHSEASLCLGGVCWCTRWNNRSTPLSRLCIQHVCGKWFSRFSVLWWPARGCVNSGHSIWIFLFFLWTLLPLSELLHGNSLSWCNFSIPQGLLSKRAACGMRWLLHLSDFAMLLKASHHREG